MSRPGDDSRFDQRPGELDATAGLGPAYALGARGPNGWNVQLLRGGVVLAEFSASDALRLAGELADLGALIERGYER